MPKLTPPQSPVFAPRPTSLEPGLRLPSARAAPWVLGLLLASAGCTTVEQGEPLPEEAPAPVVAAPTPSPLRPGAAVGKCSDVEARWLAENGSWILQNGFIGFTPNEALLVSSDANFGSGSVLRVDDGAVVGEGVMNNVIDIDPTWRRRLETEGQQVTVRELVTSEALTSLEADGWGNNAGTLSPDGGRVALVRCIDGVSSLIVRDIDAVTTVYNAPLNTAGECPGWNDLFPRVAFGSSLDEIVVGVPLTGAVHIVDIDAGTETVHTVHASGEDWRWGAPARALVDMAVDLSGELLVTTGGDGLLRRFKLPDMMEIGAPLEVGVFPLTLSVYANPHLASPVAISPDAQVVAALSPGVLSEEDVTWIERPAVVLLDVATGEALLHLEIPETERESWDFSPAMPGAFAFSPSGAALASQFGMGAMVWSCGDFAIAPGAPLSVLLDGPSTLVAGTQAEFIATHVGSDALHGHTFYVDGERVWGSGGLGRTATVTIANPGTYEVSVVVDDGASSGSASMTVTVTPAP